MVAASSVEESESFTNGDAVVGEIVHVDVAIVSLSSHSDQSIYECAGSNGIGAQPDRSVLKATSAVCSGLSFPRPGDYGAIVGLRTPRHPDELCATTSGCPAAFTSVRCHNSTVSGVRCFVGSMVLSQHRARVRQFTNNGGSAFESQKTCAWLLMACQLL
jgi:hypothetical protein